MYTTELVGSGPAGALVFPRIGGCEHSDLAPLSPDEALMELLPNVLLTDAASSQAHLDTLGRLAFDTPCYRLTAGTDLDGAAAVASVAATLAGRGYDGRRAAAATMRRFSTGGGT